MKKVLASILILTFVTTGCTGSFNLTKKVYNFHRSQTDKWADELCFLLVALTPVYGLATFGDAIIFNSIEFWSGENPITLNGETPTTKLVRQGDDEVLLTYDPKTDQVFVTPKLSQTEKSTMILERTENMVLAKNDQGQVMFSSTKKDNGEIVVYDAQGQVLKSYSAAEVEGLKEKALQ